MRIERTEAYLDAAVTMDVQACITPYFGLDVSTSGPLAPTNAPRRPGWMCGNLGRWVLAVTAATVPLTFFDIQHELRRSGSSSVTWTVRRRRGQVITLREARQIALRVFAETERRLQEDRAAEGRFFAVYGADEDAAPT